MALHSMPTQNPTSRSIIRLGALTALGGVLAAAVLSTPLLGLAVR
jgi:hypothetical protein